MDIDEAERSANEDLARVSDWWRQNGLISNHKKCEIMLIGTRNTVATSRDLQIFLDGKQLRQTNSFKYLGMYIEPHLSWNTHVPAISQRIYPKLKLLNRISKYLGRNVFCYLRYTNRRSCQ